MFRSKQINVRISPEVHKSAKIKSAKIGRSLSEVVDSLLRKWTEKQEKQEQEK